MTVTARLSWTSSVRSIASSATPSPTSTRASASSTTQRSPPAHLDTKTKELIALAIGVIQRCDGCIASHAEGAAREGASRQEAADAIGVAMLMNGGPATIYGPRAFAAFCEFAVAQ